ncbi:MAG: LemA family protein [Oscillospiraceae bacterium]|nr:LemA family protein [Oscillospiraceae bacterium]
MNFKQITNNIAFKLFILFISIVISSIIVLVIMCAFIPSDPVTDTLPEKYDKWVFVLGILLALIVNFIVEYNLTTKLKYNVSKSEAEVKAAAERRDSLLEKASRVADKYAGEEKELFSEFAEARKGKMPVRVRTSGEFRAVVESYPELKANEHVHKLLSQIESSENILYNTKSSYAESAAEFNTKIHTFPIAIFRRLFKWKDISTEALLSAEEEITDEQLGI